MLRRTVNMSVRPNNVPFNVVGGVDSGHQRCQKSRNRRESLTYGITNEIQLLTGYCGQMRPRTFINPNPIRNALANCDARRAVWLVPNGDVNV